ncbi:MAG: LolA-related protein, partial [Casimicrobiaceae bacterium]
TALHLPRSANTSRAGSRAIVAMIRTTGSISMTSGRRLHRIKSACQYVLLALALCVDIPVFAQAIEAADLLSALARVERSSATFEETRFIAALTSPIVRRGSLRYVRPDFLEMVVQSPASERMEIKGDELTLDSRGSIKRLRVSEFPAIAAWIEGLRATLAGDQQALLRYFRVRASGRMAAWTLELVPVGAELARMVSSITISGVQSQLNRIEVVERGGDRSLMLITGVDRRP